MKALGFASVPVTAVGDRAVQGFNRQALRDLTGLTGEGERPLTADELLGKYRRVFEGARRAILQIPDEQLDWMTPGRARTLRQLTWHIFDRAEEFVDLLDGGEYTEDRVDDYMTRALACRTSREIAAYGDAVFSRIEHVLTRRREALDRVLPTYFGPNTLYELLMRALSMAAFRLKGTYTYLRMLGVEPVAPLGPEDFAGIVVPSGNP